MARATVTTNEGKFYRWMIFCPGCECAHGINDGWKFNGNFDLPTFTPSILVKSRGYVGLISDNVVENTVCHSFVTDGKIRFLSDCTHALKGKTVDLPDEFNLDFDPPDHTDLIESKFYEVCGRCEKQKSTRHWDYNYGCCEECATEMSLG